MADFSRLPGPNADLWDWQLVAACRGVDSSLFFHPEGERGAARSAREASAKEVCMRCPVRAECATHALAVREPYGVWGGLTEDEREAMMGRSRSRVTESEAEVDSEADFKRRAARAERADFESEAEVEADFEAEPDFDRDFDPSEEMEEMSEHMSGSAGAWRR
ncbi:MAG: WhiB family transcriptional regulator, redox-sensing transcriptional regulator [Streptomyces sp.]|nr:WhiB family transcriptional regulator, redox-sensing transcriptional regulator [Streptomyces sp.]